MTAAALGLLAVAISALVTYLVAAKRFSGKIESTEASDLWAESASIRADYRARIEVLERENAELREGRLRDSERIARLELRLRQLEGDDAPDWLS